MGGKYAFLAAALIAAGCSSKKAEPGEGSAAGSGSAGKPVEVEKPITCPPGSVVEAGACVAVVTPQKIEAVAKQQTRLDDLAKLLDKVDAVAAPIELLNAFRKLDEWKDLTTKFDKLAIVDQVVGELDNNVKTLRAFKASLGEASGRLGNLKVELDRLMTETGTAKKLAEVRTQVSAQVRSALEPLAAQVADTIQNALTPLGAKLEEVGAVVDLTCATAKLSGAGQGAKDLCKQAKTVFETAMTYVEDFKGKPAAVFDEVTKELETQLAQLIDAEAAKLIDAAQVKVNEALKLPPAGSAAGSGSGQ